MAVRVQGYTYAGVTEPLAHYLWVHTLPEHQRGVSVVGIVEAMTFQPCPSHNLLESTAEGSREYGVVIAIAEHWAVLTDLVALKSAIRFLALP